jgi:ATP-dependent exoDNAse (exonuclease V) beta subunit
MSLGILDKDKDAYISNIVTFGAENHAIAAENLINRILSNYNDFQIKTIDSFIAKILRASALEIDLPPDFEISTESSAAIDYATESMVESVEENMLEEFADLLNKNKTGGGIDFNPVKNIKDRMKYLLETESNYNADFSFDFSFKENLSKNLDPIIAKLKGLIETAEQEGFEINGRVKQETVNSIKNYLNDKNYFALINERKKFPYKKQLSAAENLNFSEKWDELLDNFNPYMPDIARLKNLSYLTLYESFKDKLKDAYKVLGFAYISDINKKLSRFLTESSIPEIYFHLGNVIYHYFIDEFQDTSKVQWQNLKPLIEESLSKGGSLFTVGDLKQSLYGFRGADYKIMKSLIDNRGHLFPSAKEFKSISLKTNFRSDKILVDYVNNFFKNTIKDKVESVGDPAGFLTYEQDAPENGTVNNINTPGYCSTEIFEYVKGSMEDTDAGQNGPSDERLSLIESRLISIIEDLKSRGYNLNNIAVLAQKNRYLNDIGGRLTEKGYSVVTQSSLDIRNRKIIKELELLLNFLNSPADDFNFGCFVLGDIFKKALNSGKENTGGKGGFEKFIFEANLKNALRPLYVIFKENYSGLWDAYFEELFNKTGFLPLYEIVLYVYNAFNLPENFPDESAYLAHFLDIIQSIEKNGLSNLSDLLGLISSVNDVSNQLFSIELPEVRNALTLLTVHKAKGLQWDAVINVFFAKENYALSAPEANIKSNRGWNKNNFTALVEKQDGAAFLDLFYITKKMFEVKKDGDSEPHLLESIYNESAREENIDDLNNLYVALTRAKHEMFNLVISENGCVLPSSSAGEKRPLFNKKDNETSTNDGRLNKDRRIALDCGYRKINFEYAAGTTGHRYLSIKRGDFYHGVLSEIKYIEDFENLDALIEKYMILLKINNKDSKIFEKKKDIKAKILQIKEKKILLDLFDKEKCEAFTEKEYLDKSGYICRMDRISIFNESKDIYILDYKTGDMNKKEPEDYETQLSRYKDVLKDIYRDKNVSAAIYHLDNNEFIEF